MVHSEVYLNKYVVSIAPFSTPACPDCSQNIQKTALFCIFSLFNFSSIFHGGQLTPFAPMCGRPCQQRKTSSKKRLATERHMASFPARMWIGRQAPRPVVPRVRTSTVVAGVEHGRVGKHPVLRVVVSVRLLRRPRLAPSTRRSQRLGSDVLVAIGRWVARYRPQVQAARTRLPSV